MDERFDLTMKVKRTYPGWVVLVILSSLMMILTTLLVYYIMINAMMSE